MHKINVEEHVGGGITPLSTLEGDTIHVIPDPWDQITLEWPSQPSFKFSKTLSYTKFKHIF